MTDTLASRLTDLLAPVVEAEGLFLEGIETTRAGKHSVVRVIVDLPDGPGDLDLDRIGEATAALSAALDDADPVKGQYSLEVSTPGAERELRSPRHFRRAVGHSATLTTAGGVETPESTGSAAPITVTGVVTQVDDETVTIQTDGTAAVLRLDDIASARMIVVF
ncbi:ribosome maturation factor RimP [Actinomyces gaoshouyii]|uniref:ribosome maturation factor RimP n=1 Tax=Actinomyces gaoshouyii TaxID=1960083 RepID=UPI0009BE6F16|nr:ribosome maturation factor RimP [Actinomyces gaoshouyii]ARD41919.1 ribosome maturation factor [Actinomyces gaoshouyii]